ncbi:metalloprotease [Actibacterium lipolyticum]|uniref:Stage IV sporulation protein FB n=1 Tax=Actibacterium lipolyticum TaxID=1524263 RepID=A0A238KPN7_9RHOB|nr:M50 family metallopeptidase [Actibacterium lipolyticum]SMX44627.1 Stage IV sporulation protein FB [Actibacterium lipolyticum]
MVLLFSIALCALTLYSLRGGLTPSGQMAVAGFDFQGFALGGLAFAAAAFFWGPMYGLALVLSIMLHEFGHVAAFRICGHHDARFRLIPLMGGVAISDRAPDSQGEDFFITLMGPAICLAPMVLSFVLAEVAEPYSYTVADFFYTFGSVTAALNFFNLLPFWPLDGGRMTRNMTYAFWPSGARALTVLMSAALAAAAVAMQSTPLLIFAVFGAQSIYSMTHLDAVQRPMKRMHAFLAALAYFFTAAAHFVGGLWLILWFL